MAFWFEEDTISRIRSAGNHVILVPPTNPNAPLDTFDIFDGITGLIVAADIPEAKAREFATIWNTLVDSGETADFARMSTNWLIGSKG